MKACCRADEREINTLRLHSQNEWYMLQRGSMLMSNYLLIKMPLRNYFPHPHLYKSRRQSTKDKTIFPPAIKQTVRICRQNTFYWSSSWVSSAALPCIVAPVDVSPVMVAVAVPHLSRVIPHPAPSLVLVPDFIVAQDGLVCTGKWLCFFRWDQTYKTSLGRTCNGSTQNILSKIIIALASFMFLYGKKQM